jgi:hypothetical protein
VAGGWLLWLGFRWGWREAFFFCLGRERKVGGLLDRAGYGDVEMAMFVVLVSG